MKYAILPLLVLLFVFGSCQESAVVRKDLKELVNEYQEKYAELGVRSYGNSYRENLLAIPGPDTLHLQKMFFQGIRQQLSAIVTDSLGLVDLQEYKLFNWQVDFHLERLELEERFLIRQRNKPISKRGLINVELGREWYKNYLKKWLNEEVRPEELYAFGRKEIHIAQQEIQRIQQKMGYADDSSAFYQYLNSPVFFTEDSLTLLQKFEELKTVIDTNVGLLFLNYEIPEIRIAQNQERQADRGVGYYRFEDTTFFYTLLDRPFNLRSCDRLYLQQAVPGHHFESHLKRANIEKEAPFRYSNRHYYTAYSEGWAVYAESLGKELGAFADATAELGRWEWELVRSVRVVIDIGINYLGWTNREALNFWKQEIVNQDDIAKQEIQRMRDWPAQAHTYKYGARRILQLREQLREIEGEPFNLKSFHDKILSPGAMPFWLLEEMVLPGQ